LNQKSQKNKDPRIFVDENGSGERIAPLGKTLMGMRDTASMSHHDVFWR
jgi:hypothetical protein